MIRWYSICAGLVVLICAYGFFEPYWIEVRHLHVRDTHFASVFKGTLVVHLTDLHVSGIGRRERQVLKIVEDLHPDVILLTGDYVTWHGDYGPALDFLSRLKATYGIWAVMGDADYSRSRKSCLFCHEEGSGAPTRRHVVRFLRDSMEQIDLPGGQVVIAGTDVEKQRNGQAIQAFLDRLPEPAVVLAHNPLTFDQVRGDRRHVVLAGDTHGGQVPVPDRLIRLLDSMSSLKYSEGLFVKGSARMYVGRGVGTSRIPFRLFRRPEVTVIHFVPMTEGP